MYVNYIHLNWGSYAFPLFLSGLEPMKEAYGTYEDKCHSSLFNWNFCLGPVYDFSPIIRSFTSH